MNSESGRRPSELPPLAEAVLDLVELVPAGAVTTYGDLAELVGCGPRQVGRVMSRYGGAVPWWRVVRSDGRIVCSHVAEALPRLQAEGVPLRGERVLLAGFRWAGPPDAGVPAH